jgi:hypothetical protein
MADQKKKREGDVERRGGEAELQDEFIEADERAGENIIDRYDSNDRRSKRRAIFTDKYGDEDGDSRTDDDYSVMSTPSTTSTTSTGRTTSTKSAGPSKKTTSSK